MLGEHMCENCVNHDYTDIVEWYGVYAGGSVDLCGQGLGRFEMIVVCPDIPEFPDYTTWAQTPGL